MSGSFTLAERYQIERPLGQGGMAHVFAGRHRLIGKPVAVKILKTELTVDDSQAQRFLREAQTASRLAHDHIVGVIDFGRDETLGLTFLVMELLTGRSLADVLDDGPLPWPRAVAILEQICQAVAVAHAAGVIHRDLKPGNVMLVDSSGRRDVVKLCDFGLALSLEAPERMTVPGAILGTPAYMAPEQVRGEVNADERADLYAIGALAFEMLTGRLPVEAPTLIALIAAKLTAEVQPFAASVPGLPSALERLVLRCLAGNPAARPARVSELTDVLSSLEKLPPAPKSNARTRRGATGMAVALVVLVAVLAVVALRRPRRPAPTTAPVVVASPVISPLPPPTPPATAQTTATPTLPLRKPLRARPAVKATEPRRKPADHPSDVLIVNPFGGG